MGSRYNEENLWYTLAILLIIGVVIIALVMLGIVPAPSIPNQPREVPIADLPKDVPIINGEIISSTASRSDDLIRVITIVVKTNLSLPEAVKYYSDEFTKREVNVGTLPTFQGNAREIENSIQVYAIAETKSKLGLVVNIHSETQFTLVTIQVRGNSILFLPKQII
jgi:hypothetical protein